MPEEEEEGSSQDDAETTRGRTSTSAWRPQPRHGTESRKEMNLLRRRSYAMPTRWISEHMGWIVKVGWVVAHVLCVGLMVVLDSDLRRQTLALSWFAGAYYILLIVTVIQYYYTAGSSPGYVYEAIVGDENFEEQAKSAFDSSISNTQRQGRRTTQSRQVTNAGVTQTEGTRDSVQIYVSETTPLLAPSSERNAEVKSVPGANLCNRALYSNSSVANEQRGVQCRGSSASFVEASRYVCVHSYSLAEGETSWWEADYDKGGGTLWRIQCF